MTRGRQAFLRDFDELDRLAARPLDHNRTRVTKPVLLFKECDAFALELCNPGIEITDAKRHMIDHVGAAALQRLAPFAKVHDDVAEAAVCVETAEQAIPLQRGPSGCRRPLSCCALPLGNRHIIFGHIRLGTCWRIQMAAIPEPRAHRLIVKHPNAMEELAQIGGSASELDQRVIRSLQIAITIGDEDDVTIAEILRQRFDLWLRRIGLQSPANIC